MSGACDGWCVAGGHAETSTYTGAMPWAATMDHMLPQALLQASYPCADCKERVLLSTKTTSVEPTRLRTPNLLDGPLIDLRSGKIQRKADCAISVRVEVRDQVLAPWAGALVKSLFIPCYNRAGLGAPPHVPLLCRNLFSPIMHLHDRHEKSWRLPHG